ERFCVLPEVIVALRPEGHQCQSHTTHTALAERDGPHLPETCDIKVPSSGVGRSYHDQCAPRIIGTDGQTVTGLLVPRSRRKTVRVAVCSNQHLLFDLHENAGYDGADRGHLQNHLLEHVIQPGAVLRGYACYVMQSIQPLQPQFKRLAHSFSSGST